MTPLRGGADGVVDVEKINWLVVNGFESTRWKVPRRWAVIIHVSWGFLCPLLPPPRMASLLVPQKRVFLGDGACLSLDWLFPGVIWQKAPRWERAIIPETWLSCFISFQKDWFSQMPTRPCSARQPENRFSFSAYRIDKRGTSLQVLILRVPPVGMTSALETRCVASGVQRDLGIHWHPRVLQAPSFP